MDKNDVNRFTPFKKYDYTLNNKNLLLAEKIFALIELWNAIAEFELEVLNLNETVDLVDWALLHTMNITLTAEWTHYMDLFQAQLLNAIKKSSDRINTISRGFEKRFEKITYVIKNTWNLPTLDKIINAENLEIDQEIVDFFGKEQAHLISVRLIKLCESRCEDLALNLSTVFLDYLKFMKKWGRKVKITRDQILFIFDLKISLLYKCGKMQLFQEAVDLMNYQEAFACIGRFLHKKPNLLKIWKCSQKIAVLIIQTLLDKIILHNKVEQKNRLIQMLEMYLSINTSAKFLEEFCRKIRNFCERAEPSMLKVICDVLKRVNNKDIYSFVVEVFIKALTADMNELQALKTNREDFENEDQNEEAVEISTVSTRLADMFCSLAEFLDDKVKVARECVLTAFSLEPTADKLANLEALAKRSGLPVLDPADQWKCKMHPLSQTCAFPFQECRDCNEFLDKPPLNLTRRSNLALHEAISTLDLPETLCEDLIVCISNPRYKLLSWYLPWIELYKLCVIYLKDPNFMKTFITKLNFVDVDYSKFHKFQKEPVDPLAGIEKGYEKFLNKDYEEDDEEEAQREAEECAIDGENYDPNSMESLKKILSLQRIEECPEEELESTEDCCTEDREENDWNPKDTMKMSLVDIPRGGETVKPTKSEKGLKNLKRKFNFFRKEKGKKAKSTVEDAHERQTGNEGPRVKSYKKSRCPIFSKKKK